MRDIIDWLVDFEHTAAKFYTRAADYFSGDAGLAALANELAEDELWHAEIMEKSARYQIEHFSGKVSEASLVKVDVASKKKIKALIDGCMAKFDSGKVSKREFLETVIEAEYSEWNTYLLYVVHSFKELTEEFKTVPSKMHQHKERIEEYITELGDSEAATGLIDKIGRLPDLWADRFLLVVDDEDLVIDVLKAILESKGIVDCAFNGKEAFEKFNSKHYDVTITDIDMPVMDGIEFYKKVNETYTDANQRVLFFTGLVTPERSAFFHDNNIKYLIKPASIEEIIQMIDTVLRNSPKYGTIDTAQK